jgi:putative ABC transport system permease protein
MGVTYQQFFTKQMIQTFFIVALRGLRKNLLYSIINIISLGISLAVGLLVLMMLSEQKNYDFFHPDKDRIFRVLSGRSFAFNQNATAPMPIAEELHNFDQELEVLQITRSVGGDIVYEDKSIQLAGYFADPTFFEVFGFNLKQGNPTSALVEPNSVVLTEAAALSVFGSDDPLGKVINISDRGILPSGYDSKLVKPVHFGDFTVTGVLQNPPHKSHLEFDLLVSSKTMWSLQNQGIRTFPVDDWDNYFSSYTYIKVPESYDLNLLNDYLTHLTASHYTESEVYELHFELQPLTAITPGKFLNYSPSLRMPKTLYYIFGGLVLFIVLIASFNYTNITVARSMVRAKEVGIRKVSGASKSNLAMQFMVESVTLASISAIVAMFILMVLKSAFTGLYINKYLNYDLQENVHFLVYALVLVLSVGLLSGIFPSYFLSRMKPSTILKTTLLMQPEHVPFLKKISLYKALVFTQFFFSIIFIVSTILIVKQSRHYFHMDTGFSKSNIVILDMQGHSYDDLVAGFSSISEVVAVEASDMILGAGFNEKNYPIDLEENEEFGSNFPGISISKDFLDTYGIKLLAGDNIDVVADEQSVLINMLGVKVLGYENPEEVLGLTLNLSEGKEFVKIIGVTEDFKSNMPLAQNEQLMIRYLPEDFQYMSIKLAEGAGPEVFDKIKAQWQVLDPVHEVKMDLLENEIEASVSVFNDISQIIGFITGVSIFISCFGLLGITAFVTERRIKEIGVRKIFGANMLQLHGLLSKSFVKLILVSALVAAPFAFLINGIWLDKLANKVSFGLDTVLLGIAIILVLAFLTISIMVIRLSLVNPINILRDE